MANREFTKTIVGELSAALKPLGFRKHGLTFTRDANGLVQIIALQKSASSTADVLKITANAGLWVCELAPVWAGVPDAPDIWSAHWRVRVGELSPERTDLWWSVASHEAAASVAADLATRVLEFLLPEMARLSSRDAMVRLWQSGSAPGLTSVQRARYLANLLVAAAN